jgi:hypothetical protein
MGTGMRSFLTTLLAGLSLAAPVLAQQSAQQAPMVMGVVRLALPGCDPHCPEFVSLQGVVQPGSDKRLQAVLDGVRERKLPVIIHSPGGNVDAALAMGKMIRAHGLDVAVARTSPATICPPGDAACDNAQRGKPPMRALSFDQTICSSACTLVLAGGLRRIVMPTARIGVHQMVQSETERVIERTYGRSGGGEREIVSEKVLSQRTRNVDAPAEVANRGVPEHFTAMGISKGFTDLTLATPHSQIRVLSPREMLETGIATHGSEPLKVLGFQPR